MTDVALVSTSNSSFEKEMLLATDSWKDKFVYFENRKYPILHKKVITQSPNTTVTGKTYGSQVIFDIPKYGGLYRCYIETVLGGTANITSTTDTRFGAKFYSSVDVTNKSRLLQRQTALSCEADINNSQFEKMNGYIAGTTPAPALANSTASTIFTPCFFWFNNEKTVLDTQHVEDIQIVCTVNSFANLFKTGDTYTWTFDSATLVCEFIQFESPTRDMILNKNFGQGNSLSMKVWDNEPELQQTLTYASGTTLSFSNIELRNKYLTFATHLKARNVTTGLSLPIISANLTSNSQELYNRTAKRNVYLEDDKLFGNVQTNLTHTIFYGMDKSKYYSSGELAYYSLKPILTVVVDTSSGVSGSDVITLEIAHDFHSAIEIDGLTKSISKILST